VQGVARRCVDVANWHSQESQSIDQPAKEWGCMHPRSSRLSRFGGSILLISYQRLSVLIRLRRVPQ
jgi:hypothetical protein